MKPTFRTIYSHDRAISALFATQNTEESLTQQDDAKDADINVIVGRFMKTGQLPTVTAQAISGDFTNATDFRGMLDKVREAQEQFMLLPAPIRTRFDNDPAKFIDFATKEENLDELRKMGLAHPPKQKPEPMRVIIDTPEPAK